MGWEVFVNVLLKGGGKEGEEEDRGEGRERGSRGRG